MLSKSRLSFIKSLHTKKSRVLNNLFIAEGSKIISELILSDYAVETIYSTAHSIGLLKDLILSARKNIEINEVSSDELQKISLMQSPQHALALVKSPINELNSHKYPLLACDDIQDPGNMGTIIRIADWFGFQGIALSQGCVEWQNPKVIQASMGSFMRVPIGVMDLPELFNKKNAKVYGAVLTGKKIQETEFLPESILLLGNEGHGIRANLLKYIDYPITIPKLGKAESLNVGVAAAIICAEMQRKLF